MNAPYLDRQLRAAGIPIDGVSIGDAQNRATWRVDFRPEATAAQRTQAADMIAAFVPPTGEEIAEDEAQREADLRILKAIVIELHAAIPAWAGKPTLVQLRSNIIARYKALAS